MDLAQLQALYDQEQRINLALPGASVEAAGPVVRLLRPAPGMNIVIHSLLEPATADATIAAQVAELRQRGQPFSWRLYDHDPWPGLADRLVAHGFVADTPDPVLALDIAAAQLPAPDPAVTLRRLRDPAELAEVVAVEEQVWGGDFGWLARRLAGQLAEPGYLSVYLAEIDGAPAAAGWIAFHPNSQFVTLYGGSTVERHRRRGLYGALLAARLAEARERGRRFALIEPSEHSEPLVRRRGFQLLTTARDYVWSDPAAQAAAD